MFDGRELVKYIDLLLPEEEASIKTQINCKVSLKQMQVNLERQFPHRSFDYQLLFRIQETILNANYGKDRQNLHGLFECGSHIRRLGGVFEVTPSDKGDFDIAAIHFQTKLMGDYATMYGEDGFKMLDGTHHLSANNMKFMPWMVIDCLFHSKFAGFTASFSENSEHIIEGAKLFFPNKCDKNNATVEVGELGKKYFDPLVDTSVTIESSDDDDTEKADKDKTNQYPTETSVTLLDDPVEPASTLKQNGFMTDEGSGFPSVAKEFGWRQIFNRYHFTDQIESSWVGLPNPCEFRKDVHAILDAPSASIFEELISSALSKYTNNDGGLTGLICS